MKMFVSSFLFKSLHSALIRGARGPQLFFWYQMLHRYGVDLLQVAQFGGNSSIVQKYYSYTLGVLKSRCLSGSNDVRPSQERKQGCTPPPGGWRPDYTPLLLQPPGDGVPMAEPQLRLCEPRHRGGPRYNLTHLHSRRPE